VAVKVKKITQKNPKDVGTKSNCSNKGKEFQYVEIKIEGVPVTGYDHHAR